jgi:hypothetical protein
LVACGANALSMKRPNLIAKMEKICVDEENSLVGLGPELSKINSEKF